MAELFLAELEGAKGFRKRVVVKTLRTEHLDDEHQQSMFADEARVGSHIEHPHIPRVLELGEHRGLPFMVQEYVEGPSLEVVLQRERATDQLDRRFGVRVVADVARALHHAYHLRDETDRALHVVHRDVSPSNVLVARSGSAKLIDFGVARFEHRETHTEGNILKGKLRYLAPETLTQGTVSHATDLYALGVVLYMATTCTAPWRSASDMGKRMRGDFDPPSTRVDGYPASLEDIVLRCLSVEPRDRYGTGAELADQLEAWLEAHGGPQTDAAQAAHIESLFPDGPDDWLPTFDLGALAAPDAPEGSLSRTELSPWPWVGALLATTVLAAIGLAVVSLVVLTGQMLAPRATPPPEPPAPMAPAADGPRAAFDELAARADEALGTQDYARAARHGRALRDLPLVDPDLLSERQELLDDIDVAIALHELSGLGDDADDEVLRRTQELARSYPDHPQVLAALEAAQRRIDERARAARRTEQAKPRPAPPPTGPSMLTVEGGPAGAEVLVDGRVVGTVPMQLVIDPGNHDVSLRKEGYVQQRAHIEATGKPLTVRLDLAPMTDR